MQHIADASANGIIRRSLLAATIGLVAIFASIVVGQPFASDTARAASATSGEGPQVSLICKRVTASGMALCRLTSVEKLEVGDQVTFQASTPDGSQQDVTIEYQGRVGFRDAPSCDSSGACYLVWFRMQQPGASQVAISSVTYQPVGSTAPETIIEQPETQAVVAAISPTISPTIGNTQQAGVQTGGQTGEQGNGDQSTSGQATSAPAIEIGGGGQAQIGASQQQSKPTNPIKEQSQQQPQQQAQASPQQVSTQQPSGQAQGLSQQQQSETQSESQQQSSSSNSGSQAETNGKTTSKPTVTIKAEETTDGTKVVVTDGEQTRTHDSTNEAENDDPQEENKGWKKDIEKAVDNGKTISINTGVGTGTPSEQFTTIQIEQEAYDAGEPYEVCFDHPERIRPGKTVVSGGKTIVIPTIVTPAETICHMVTPE